MSFCRTVEVHVKTVVSIIIFSTTSVFFLLIFLSLYYLEAYESTSRKFNRKEEETQPSSSFSDAQQIDD